MAGVGTESRSVHGLVAVVELSRRDERSAGPDGTTQTSDKMKKTATHPCHEPDDLVTTKSWRATFSLLTICLVTLLFSLPWQPETARTTRSGVSRNRDLLHNSDFTTTNDDRPFATKYNRSRTLIRRPQPLGSAWHPQLVPLDELVSVEALQPGRLEVVQHHVFGARPMLLKIADSAHEATMYRLLYGLGVTPQFLAHVTEGQKGIVGFLVEYIQPTATAAVTTTRREACLAALRQMHRRGIVHGDAHEGNCLARGDGTAVLVDFELSIESVGRAEIDRDLWIMDHTVMD